MAWRAKRADNAKFSLWYHHRKSNKQWRANGKESWWTTKNFAKWYYCKYLKFHLEKQRAKCQRVCKAIQIHFNGKQLDSNAFYHGADIIKKQYIKLLQISGLLTRERDKLRAELKNAPKNINLIQTLAYVDIFTNDFDESYKLYNQAIDEFKVNDASTLFLASVAATGAGKVSNAIALLELTKLNDASAIENRIALGLMYQQIDNIKAALIQYSKIGNVEYESEFYDFEIDNDW